MEKTDINFLKVNKLKEPLLVINGGYPLKGTIEIEGAKNAALPAIVAACLSEETIILSNVPVKLNDVKQLVELLIDMGADIKISYNENVIKCNGGRWQGGNLNGNIAGKIRHSLLILGLSASWSKRLFLPMPGGCDLGSRKHDMHIDALRTLGHFVQEDAGIFIEPEDSSSDKVINFYYPTFGGTFNAIFASVKLKGRKTTINNAARNPEVLDVINMLNNMGAKITWVDNKTLIVVGVDKLIATEHSIMPDRIIGATMIAATGVTNGKISIKNFQKDLLKEEIEVWEQTGMKIIQKNTDLYIDGTQPLTATNVETSAYPGFHTDVQPLHTLLMTTASGQSEVKETILDGRFKYCSELNKMGANITVVEADFTCVNGAPGQIAKIKGVASLYPANVKATDIRGGAAVAVAALAASGQSTISNLYQLERGYGNFVELFSKLGADVKRVQG